MWRVWAGLICPGQGQVVGCRRGNERLGPIKCEEFSWEAGSFSRRTVFPIEDTPSILRWGDTTCLFELPEPTKHVNTLHTRNTEGLTAGVNNTLASVMCLSHVNCTTQTPERVIQTLCADTSQYQKWRHIFTVTSFQQVLKYIGTESESFLFWTTHDICVGLPYIPYTTKEVTASVVWLSQMIVGRHSYSQVRAKQIALNIFTLRILVTEYRENGPVFMFFGIWRVACMLQI